MNHLDPCCVTPEVKGGPDIKTTRCYLGQPQSTQQNKDVSSLCNLKRMEGKCALLWLLLIAAVVLQSSAQHWSHGLSPGGKREAHSLTEVMEGLPKRSASLCGSEYRDVSPYKRPDRLEQLVSLMEGENVAYD